MEHRGSKHDGGERRPPQVQNLKSHTPNPKPRTLESRGQRVEYGVIWLFAPLAATVFVAAVYLKDRFGIHHRILIRQAIIPRQVAHVGQGWDRGII